MSLSRRKLLAAAAGATGAGLACGAYAGQAVPAGPSNDGLSNSETRRNEMAELSDVERHDAILKIHELQARRCLAVDTKDWATHETLHAADFRSYLAEGNEFTTGGKAYTDRIAAQTVHRLSAHHIYTPIIAFESPTQASALWTMEDWIWWKQGDEDHWLHGFGFYDETYVKLDGKWLFASRRLRRHKVLTSPGADLTKPATAPATAGS
jgi:hypothetical protein